MDSEKLKNSGFARLYVWMSKAKYTMAIFFVVFVALYLFFGVISEGSAVTLDLYTAIQMVLACFFIGFFQQVILPTDKLGRTRAILWVLLGVAVTLLFSLIFKWFARFPLWCFIVFMALIAVAMLMVVLGYYLELHRETKRLNHGLGQFKKWNHRTEG